MLFQLIRSYKHFLCCCFYIFSSIYICIPNTLFMFNSSFCGFVCLFHWGFQMDLLRHDNFRMIFSLLLIWRLKIRISLTFEWNLNLFWFVFLLLFTLFTIVINLFFEILIIFNNSFIFLVILVSKNYFYTLLISRYVWIQFLWFLFF